MNFKIFSYITLFVLIIGLSACHDGDLPDVNKQVDAVGQVNLHSLSIDVTNAENIYNTSVGSGSRADIDMSVFNIEIKRTSNNALVRKWAFNEMPEIFELPVGNYKAIVYNTVTADADFDTPYFYGESEFSIVQNHVTEIDKVVCKLANIKVTIKFKDELRELLEDDVTVDVTCGASSLKFTKEIVDQERSGYFKGISNSNTLVAVFNATINGQKEEHTLPLDGIAPGQHRIITYNVKNPSPGPGGSTGTIDPSGIDIDVDVENEDLTANVDNKEENIENPDEPGKEDPYPNGGGEDPNPPTPPADNTIEITAVEPLSFDKDNSVEALIKEKASAIVNITAEKGITNFVVSIETSSSVFESIFSAVIPFEFDLAYPDKKVKNGEVVGEYEEGEYENVTATYEGFGFPVGADVKGATHLEFNITDFLDPLSSFNGTHRFTLIVTDSTGNKSKKTLTLTVTEGSM